MKMNIIKRIVNYEEDVDIYLLSDGEFLIHAIKEYLFENRTGEHEHPMLIIREPWNLFNVSLRRWVFKRVNINKEQILVLKEVARMKLEDFGVKRDDKLEARVRAKLNILRRSMDSPVTRWEIARTPQQFIKKLTKGIDKILLDLGE